MAVRKILQFMLKKEITRSFSYFDSVYLRIAKSWNVGNAKLKKYACKSDQCIKRSINI